MSENQARLYHVHDPMCSWCWGYRPTWLRLRSALPAELDVVNVVGGLAPDSDEPMPADLQKTIQGHWQNINQLLGTEFNFEFWNRCQPRRDTYKACRAVVAAAAHGQEEAMIEAVQRAYYLRAMNPSEPETLVRIAGELGLEPDEFRNELFSETTETEFRRQLLLARRLGVNSFPTLVLQTGKGITKISHDYQDHLRTLREIESVV